MSSFANIEQFKSNKPKVNFVKIQAGYPVRLRILDETAHVVYKHFLPAQKLSVECPGGDECPVCRSNAELVRTNTGVPYNQIKGIMPKSPRYMCNVLNRTLAKVASNGTVIFAAKGKFPDADPDTGELLVNIEAKPLNRVEILERGVSLFQQLNVVQREVVDPVTGVELGLNNFDVVISADGKGMAMATQVIPYPQYNDKIDMTAYELYNLEDVGLKLTGSEIKAIMGGTQLRDVLAARGNQGGSVLTDDEGAAFSSVSDSISSLFGD